MLRKSRHNSSPHHRQRPEREWRNRFTNRFVEDGSYIRIKNVQLATICQHSLLRGQSVLKAVRLTVERAEPAHLHQIHRVSIPEVGAYLGKEVQLNSQLIAVDAGRYPLTRMYSASIGVDF